jgi:hypothetical protein
VFTRPSAPTPARAEFRRLPAPAHAELQIVVVRVYRRFVAWLRRRELLRPWGDSDTESWAAPPSAIEACLLGSLGVGNLETLPDADGEPVPGPR